MKEEELKPKELRIETSPNPTDQYYSPRHATKPPPYSFYSPKSKVSSRISTNN